MDITLVKPVPAYDDNQQFYNFKAGDQVTVGPSLGLALIKGGYAVLTETETDKEDEVIEEPVDANDLLEGIELPAKIASREKHIVPRKQFKRG